MPIKVRIQARLVPFIRFGFGTLNPALWKTCSSRLLGQILFLVIFYVWSSFAVVYLIIQAVAINLSLRNFYGDSAYARLKGLHTRLCSLFQQSLASQIRSRAAPEALAC